MQPVTDRTLARGQRAPAAVPFYGLRSREGFQRG